MYLEKWNLWEDGDLAMAEDVANLYQWLDDENFISVSLCVRARMTESQEVNLSIHSVTAKQQRVRDAQISLHCWATQKVAHHIG